MLIRLLFPAAIAVAALLSGEAWAQTGRAAADQRISSHAEFETMLLRTESGPILAAILRNYPAEGRAYLNRLYDISATSRTRPEVNARYRAEQATFLAARLPDYSNAPAPALLAAVRARLDLYQTIADADVAMCGRLLGRSEGANLAAMPAAQLRQRDALIALIDAGGAGRPGPRLAGRGRPSDGDRRALAVALRTLDPQGELLPFLGRLSSAPVDIQCRGGILIYRAMLSMPPESGAAIFVQLLQQEFAPTGTAPTSR